MNKMRENTGVILWILVFAFGIIWVLQDTGALDVVGQGNATNIVMVDGDPITYEEFTRAVDAQVQQYQQQTGESMPPQMIDQQREAVFQQLVDGKLREHEMDRLGISVTDEEIYEMVMGDTPHPIIKVYFGDQEGNVDRALLQNFVQNPEARQDWIQIENYLRSERRREKMDNLISATVRVSEEEVRDEHRRRNLRVDAEWVGLRYADLPNDSVTVTDRDFQRFYDEHKEDYERKRTYQVKYVTRTKQPSPQDSSAIRSELERLRPRFQEAIDDSVFLARNASEIPFDSAWVAANDLDPEIAAAVFESPTPGRVAGPIFSGDRAHLVKIVEIRPSERQAVRARHILLRSAEDDEQIRNRLVEIKNAITNADEFAAQARQHSQDGSAAAGGDLGWFGSGQMVEQFEEAAFGA
ncbi:MAG: peptidylprolyl isomerase, partial [Rhodothermales bacterium]